MSLAEKEQQLTAELAGFKNGQDRLAHLVELARRRAPLAPDQRTDANLIPGCLARLWFVAEYRDDRCYYASDSDSLIVKAVAGLLCDFYSGNSPRQITAHDPKFLGPLGITQHLTPNRRNALSRVWELIWAFAESKTGTR